MEQERYRMRSSNHITGIEEKKDEDIKAQVILILSRAVPDLGSKLEDAVDVVHRMGKKMDKRHILFTLRQVKEVIWKRSKNSTFFKEKGIRLAEMLSTDDLEERR